MHKIIINLGVAAYEQSNVMVERFSADDSIFYPDARIMRLAEKTAISVRLPNESRNKALNESGVSTLPIQLTPGVVGSVLSIAHGETFPA